LPRHVGDAAAVVALVGEDLQRSVQDGASLVGLTLQGGLARASGGAALVSGQVDSRINDRP